MPLLSSLSSVPWVQILGALVLVLTGVHSLFLLIGKVWAPALYVAELTGVVAVDVQQVIQWFTGAGLAKKVGPIAIIALLWFVACSPSELQQAATVADDVNRVAQVLCLADHARAAHARALSVSDACSTVEQLAPYLEQAKGALPRAACAKLDTGSDAGAP